MATAAFGLVDPAGDAEVLPPVDEESGAEEGVNTAAGFEMQEAAAALGAAEAAELTVPLPEKLHACGSLELSSYH